MIECVITLDYEIYGSGAGSLKDLVYEPADKLATVLEKFRARMVVFVEAAELEIIEASGADRTMDLVKGQLRDFRDRGFELGLHLHPQWYNARLEKGRWALDYGEYNLCVLSPERIEQILDRSISYLRQALGEPGFAPLAFRAGNWLMQPTAAAAESLVRHGIKIDSSVFIGGLQHQYGLDYRRSRRNGYFWPFSGDVNIPDPGGSLLELPTYTRMVPAWKMLSAKRLGLQKKRDMKLQDWPIPLSRFRDFLRPWHPMKLDFCRLTAKELTWMLDEEIRKDRRDPGQYRPLVAIGHTKDLVDFDMVEAFLSYLRGKDIPASTFKDVHDHITARI